MKAEIFFKAFRGEKKKKIQRWVQQKTSGAELAHALEACKKYALMQEHAVLQKWGKISKLFVDQNRVRETREHPQMVESQKETGRFIYKKKDPTCFYMHFYLLVKLRNFCS